MMRVSFLVLVMLPLLVKAQVTIEDFLLASLDAPAVQALKNQQAYLQARPFRLSPIQQLQIRTESNQLDPERQDYALRLTPSNPWEVKRTNQYFKAYQESLELDRERELKESLLARYEVIIDWLYYQEILLLKSQDRAITEKLLGIMEGQRFSGFFDGEDYVELKMELIDRVIEVEETNFELDQQRRKIESLYEPFRQKPIHWSVETILNVDQVERITDSLLQVQTAGGEVAYREKQIDLANREWQLEKANINIGYLQAQYQQFREEQGRKPWNIGLGVTIPVFNPNKSDMAKRKLESIEAEGELNQTKWQQQQGRELSYSKIKSLLQRYKEINTMMQDLKVGTLATTLQQIHSSNPTTLMRLEAKTIKLKATATRIKQEIYFSYIEFLSYSELLQRAPLINYLSPQLRTLTGS